MAREEGSPDFRDFDARMRKLRAEAGLDQTAEQARPPGMVGAGVHVGIELVAGVIGGALIGYGLDRWLATWPALFVVFFFLGSAAGMLNAYRYVRRASEGPEQEPKDRRSDR
ncbi:MAG: AtpZ/AtpI family protein [Geminicoccaceae bacterium]